MAIEKWTAEDRGGVTRDPFHPHASAKVVGKPGKQTRTPGIYAPNFKELKFFLDGEELDQRAVHSAFPTLGKIWLFKRTEAGFIMGSGTTAEYLELEGEVRVEGECRGCTGCVLKGRRVPGWWKRKDW